MWKEFFILEFRVLVKAYENASKFGLSQYPKISKFEVWSKGKQLANFDRGWDFNNLPEWALDFIIKSLNKLLFLVHLFF